MCAGLVLLARGYYAKCENINDQYCTDVRTCADVSKINIYFCYVPSRCRAVAAANIMHLLDMHFQTRDFVSKTTLLVSFPIKN